ncbi:putative ribonuclease H-like domain-containing protein, partial [Tanacetum coccineum]
MSSMGELTFFLGLQVQQKEDGIFISQDKYVAEILKKFNFAAVKTSSTPMEPNKALVKDEEADSSKDSPFNLEAFSNSDYAGASLDRKSITGGLLYAAGQKLVLSGIELVLPGNLSTAGLPLEEVLTEENVDFHQILDFLTSSLINFALTEDKGMAFVQEKDAENQGKIGDDDTEVVKGSGDTEVLDTKKAVNTAGKGVSTTNVP